MSVLTCTCIAGLLALGWVASKLHTVASKKWIPMKDHDNTCRHIAEVYEQRFAVGIEQEWEGMWRGN